MTDEIDISSIHLYYIGFNKSENLNNYLEHLKYLKI